MAFVRLVLCVAGVYTMFLAWAVAQERLSVPFKAIDGRSSEKFKSPLFMATCQSVLSSISALIYILLRAKSTETISQSLGLEPSQTPSTSTSKSNGSVTTNGNEKNYTNGAINHSPKSFRGKLLRSYLQCSVFITCAAPFGFAALSYISYPAMVLGKSCKLVPVMIMNIILYRRRFAPHKYLVVFIVTIGITIFMGFSNDKAKSSKAHNPNSRVQTPYGNLIGITYLLINLTLDGAINSTQDEIFARYKVTGQQMMFWINIFCTLITLMMTMLPLPHIPVIHPSTGGQAEFMDALAFIHNHPSIIKPLALFALTGALGQLFIFETLQHFGSLTLVTITLTRKLFTMLLSVIVYNHKLTSTQWLGTAVVFSGISIEAFVKRKDVHAKRVIQEKEKAEIKTL